MGVVAVLVVAPRWIHSLEEATTVRLDGAERSAERWIVDNVPHDKRLLIEDSYWAYLVEHGWDHQPVQGGFFSRTLADYWPYDFDPAVKRHFPGGWRDLDYVVSTPAMRGTLDRTPLTAEALRHSKPVAQFGGEDDRVEVRAITGAAASPAPLGP